MNGPMDTKLCCRRGLAIVIAVAFLVGCAGEGIRPIPQERESTTTSWSGTPDSQVAVTCAAWPVDTIAAACNPPSGSLNPACLVPMVPGETALDEAREALSACELVDSTSTYEGPWPDPSRPGETWIGWRCTTCPSCGEKNAVVVRDGVVQWLLWEHYSAVCGLTAGELVERLGAPEKVLQAIARSTTGCVSVVAVMLYPTRGLVAEVDTTLQNRSVKRQDLVITEYRFRPTTLADLIASPAQYQWQMWQSVHEGGTERIPWPEKLEDWPGFSP